MLRKLLDAIRPRSGINDGSYWDRYVRQWSSDDNNRGLPFVGSEWKGEDIFLSMLNRFSAEDAVALEIGCGGGRITAHAAPLFKSIHACDVSLEMIRANKSSVRAQNVSYALLDGFSLRAFQDASVDCVFSHDVFVHFSSLQVYPYLLEIKRILKVGGVGIVSFYNFKRHFELFKKMSMDFNAQRVYPPHMRVHFVTQEMIECMISDAGLTLVEADTTNFLIAVFRK